MTSTSNADSTIEALLQQRAQYEQWLARLESTADKAPAAVRSRVRADYEVRLKSVIEELRGHGATIAQELEQHRATHARLDAERQKAEEVLAEAEVRYAVGEYQEDEWQRLNDESQRHLEGIRAELQSVEAEITRLAEVQGLITAPAKEAPPVQPQVVQPERVAVARAVDDELMFLKSVSDDTRVQTEERKPAAGPRRSSNPAVGAAAKSSEPVTTAAPAPVPISNPGPVTIPIAATVPAPSTPATPTPAPAGKAAGMVKTLKCNECGTFNRPTEWYCERCGAELAAL